jgi:TetR/AcrR family transcriptional repressor of nem operon
MRTGAAKLPPSPGKAAEAGTRARLIATAEALVRKRGYAGFSYADVADAAGLRKASIHYYFPTKEDLGVALIESYRKRYDAALAAIWEESELAAVRISAYARLYREAFGQDEGCLCGVLACERDILPRRLRDGITQFFEAHLSWLERILEAGIRSGTVRRDIDACAHAKLVLSALQGALMLGHISGSAEGLDATAASIVRSLE